MLNCWGLFEIHAFALWGGVRVFLWMGERWCGYVIFFLICGRIGLFKLKDCACVAVAVAMFFVVKTLCVVTCKRRVLCRKRDLFVRVIQTASRRIARPLL